MRILHLIPSLEGGGAERQLGYLAAEHARMGHEVHIAFTHHARESSYLSGVHYHRLATSSNYDPRLLWRFFRLFRRLKPDLVQTWILQMDILAAIATKLSRVPWVFREPSSASGYGPGWKNRLRVLLGGGAAAIIANSRGGDDYWCDRQPSSLRFLIPNGLPLTDIAAATARPIAGIPEINDPLLLSVGRLSADHSGNKNLETLLKALVLLRKNIPLMAVLCGEGPQRDALEAIRRDLGLAADTRLPGHLSAGSVWALMKRASVFVSLSAFEGCPNAVMEAMACGCPLVLSDIPAHRELVDETGTVFVAPTDAQEVAVAIMKLFADPVSAQQRAKVAHEIAMQWSIERMAKAFEKVYLQLL